MRYGVTEVDISPNLPVSLGGFGYGLERLAKDVDLPLKATVVAMEDEAGSKAAICGLDAMAVDEKHTRLIIDGVRAAVEDGEAVVMLAASHTHSAPNMVDDLIGVGSYEHAYAQQVVVPRVTQAIISAFNVMTEGQLNVRRGLVSGLTYDRTQCKPRDAEVTRIELMNGHGMVMDGIHFGCHPVMFGKDTNILSPDFPGHYRQYTATQTKHGAPVLWLPGCGAEINPINSHHTEGLAAENFAEKLACRSQALIDLHRIEDEILRKHAGYVDLPVRNRYSFSVDAEIERFMVARNISREGDVDLSPIRKWLEVVGPVVDGFRDPAIAVPVVAIALGSIVFIGLGGEVQSKTAQELAQRFPDHTLLVTMTTNGYKGYLPETKGYEHSAFQTGRPPMAGGAEEQLLDQTSAIIESII